MRLRLNSDIMGIFPQDIPEVKGLQNVRSEFMNEGELIVVMHNIDEEQIIELATHLKEKNIVAQARWRAQWLDHPDTMADLLAYLWWNGSEESVQGMTDRIRKENSQVWLEHSMETLATSLEGQDMAIAARDPFGFMNHPALEGLKDAGVSDSFSSADGMTRLLFLQHQALSTGHAAAQQWINQVNAEIKDWASKNNSSCTWQMTGDPAFVAEIGGAMEHDMKSSIWVTTLIFALLCVAEIFGSGRIIAHYNLLHRLHTRHRELANRRAQSTCMRICGDSNRTHCRFWHHDCFDNTTGRHN
jgi:hypothetical protein